METTTTPPAPVLASAPSTPAALWTCDEVAAFLRCTARHVHNLLGRGLPHLYVGRLLRFDPAEVRAYLTKYRRFGRRA
jgi:excisionase family DNA binding protein